MPRHHEVGAQLKRIRDDLQHIQVELLNAYSVTGRGPVASKAMRLIAPIDALRSALENAAMAEHGDAVTAKTYYPVQDDGRRDQ